jgi:DNA (cytosine-5)-methyltransferase 1
MYRPTAKSYCSGAGLMDLGMSNAGIDIVKSLEIDSVCCDTLRLNFKHAVDPTDIRNITVLEQEKTDVIIGTYPCTKYSSIADLHGTRTGDDIFLHFFRHIAIEQPEAYVVENVPGMKKFPVVMEAMTKLPGYYLNVFCPLDANNWLPQNRERLILIGTKKDIMISPPQRMQGTRLKDIIDSNPDMEVPKYILNRLKGQYRDKPIISDPAKNDVAPTCLAHYAKDQGTRMVVDKTHPLGVRPYSVREYARLQGVPDWFQFAGTDQDAYRQIGNGVAVPVAEWIGGELIKYFN